MPDTRSLLLVVAESFLTQAGGYFALVGLVFLIVWRWGRERFRGARIPQRDRFDAAQLRREVLNTLLTMLFATLQVAGILALARAGYLEISSDRSRFTLPGIVASVLALIVFNDAWFYWCHRLLHRPWLFRHVHSVHHRSVDVNPFTSYSFHAVEAVVLSAGVVPLLLVMPMYAPALGVVQVIGLVNNVVSHLGYEFLPRWFVRVPPLRWLSSATYHSLHHTKFRGNYGLFFRFWDRLMGTELPGYEETFVRRGAEAPAEPVPGAPVVPG